MLLVHFLPSLQLTVLEVSIEGKGRDDGGWKDKNTEKKLGESMALIIIG